MNRIRLLCIGRGLYGGGAERVQLTLLKYLDRSKFDITLFYLRNEGVLYDLIPNDITPVYGVSGNQSLKLNAMRVFRALLRIAREQDLIFAMQDGTPIYLGALVARVVKRPCIAWMHSMLSFQIEDLQSWHKMVYSILYSLPDCIIAVSKGAGENLMKKVAAVREKTVVLPNPIDIQPIAEIAEQHLPAWASEIYEKPTLVAAGRLVRLKGFDILIEAMSMILTQRRDINLIILGEGSERENLERLVKQKGLERKVFLPGFHKNIYPFLKKASVFVLSSRYESFSTVILEALCLGVPVVATECPSGPREILKNGEYGVLVETENPDALANGIMRVLDDRSLASRLRNVGPRRAQDFEARHIAKRFEELFSTMLRDCAK